MVEVTVLMAVYNAAQTLARALDSLLRQSLEQWQVVCVDDASTDASLRILHDYAARDARVKVVSLPVNGGQAHARNVGLSSAEGRYVTFLDADDWLSDDALAQVVAVLRQHPLTDCVLFDLRTVSGKGEVKPYPQSAFEVLGGREAFGRSLEWRIHGVYAARREMYERVPYDDTCRTYSDDNTTHLHYYLSREVRTCAGIYYYSINPHSSTHAPTVRRYDYLRANESLLHSLRTLGVDEEVMSRYENVRWRVLVDVYQFHHLHARDLSASDRRYGLAQLKRIWQGIDRSRLDGGLTRKFGYRPMPSWPLFRLQEWLYFTLRGWLGKNRGK